MRHKVQLLAEVANVLNETCTAFADVLPLLLFFNDSTINESRISAFSPTETNRVPISKQTRFYSEDSPLLLIRDH